jgi:hypothetical protein
VYGGILHLLVGYLLEFAGRNLTYGALFGWLWSLVDVTTNGANKLFLHNVFDFLVKI